MLPLSLPKQAAEKTLVLGGSPGLPRRSEQPRRSEH
jgi:hypothetical protein